jgi:hypothetical protein
LNFKEHILRFMKKEKKIMGFPGPGGDNIAPGQNPDFQKSSQMCHCTGSTS